MRRCFSPDPFSTRPGHANITRAAVHNACRCSQITTHGSLSHLRKPEESDTDYRHTILSQHVSQWCLRLLVYHRNFFLDYLVSSQPTQHSKASGDPHRQSLQAIHKNTGQLQFNDITTKTTRKWKNNNKMKSTLGGGWILEARVLGQTACLCARGVLCSCVCTSYCARGQDMKWNVFPVKVKKSQIKTCSSGQKVLFSYIIRTH